MSSLHQNDLSAMNPFRGVRHFSGLNSLRFIAAVLVLLSHGEAIRTKRGLPGLAEFDVFNNGSLAVSFFFVLSGFLICYLLFEEKETRGGVQVGAFYRRRALRILPLYSVLVTAGLLIIPSTLPLLGIHYSLPYRAPDVIVWYALLMPFVVNILYDVFVIGPLWSIGIEEWFYLLIAPLFRLNESTIIRTLYSVIIIKIIALTFVDLSASDSFVARLLTLASFEHMAVGGLAALYLRRCSTAMLPRVCWNPVVRSVVIAIILIRIAAHSWAMHHLPVYAEILNGYAGTSVVDGLLFGWVILDIASQGARANRKPEPARSLLARAYAKLEYAGSLSYGIYMYHNIVAFGLTYGMMTFWQSHSLSLSLPIYHTAVLGCTIITAAISKRFFEDRFQRYRS
jgi:peptidoglycan/LPS O-acetylase OafA/YrhL